MKKKQVLYLNWLPTSFNEYIAAERTNRYIGGKIKREETERAWADCLQQRLKPMSSPVQIDYHWMVKNRKKDKSNIVAFARKVLEDSLVTARVLKNDGWNDIKGFSDSFELNEQEGVIITITEL